MKKALIALAVVLLLSFATLFYLYSQATRVPDNTAAATLKLKNAESKPYIVFLGDSITHGRVSYDYVSALSRLPSLSKYTLVNDGINSSLTNQVLDKLKYTLALKPELVFIMIGTNDLKASLSPEEYNNYNRLWNLPEVPTDVTYQKNLKEILRRLKAKTQARIILISIPVLGEDPGSLPFKKSQRYAALVKDIALQQSIDYIPYNETLVAELQKAGRPNPGPYNMDIMDMTSAIFKHFLLFSSWDEISDQKGRLFLPDNIHLNTRAGKILEGFILEQLVQK